jgi:hypothetical protein
VPVNSDKPLSFQGFAVLDSVLIAAEARTGLLWRLPFHDSIGRADHWVDPGPQPPKISALAGGSEGIAAIDAQGRLIVRTRGGEAIHELDVRPVGPQRLLGLASLSASSWVMLAMELPAAGSGGYSVHRIAVRRITSMGGDTVLLRSEVGDARASVSEHYSLSTYGDTIALTMATPPRVVVFSQHRPQQITEHVLKSVPRRRPSDADLAAMEREVRALPKRVRAASSIPHLYPPLLSGWVRNNRLLAMAATGPETVGLDLYCNFAFVRPVLSSADIITIYFTGAHVIALHEHESGDRSLLVYLADQLASECET